MSPNQALRKAGGRPRKYPTKEAAAQAKRESNQRSRQRLHQHVGPADFIAYEPPLHSNAPTETPPEIGLRTSIDIPIPSRDDARRDDVPQCLRPISLPPTQLSTAADDPELAEQIQQIRADEQESILERTEYDAEIANILLGMRSDNTIGNMATSELQEIEEAEAAATEETANEEESQRSYLTQLALAEEPIMWDNNSVAASYTSDRSATIPRAREPVQAPQTPARRSSPLQTPSQSKNSQRSASFPSQKNNLLSWMKPLSNRSPANSTASTPATQNPPGHASSSPFHRTESFASSLPALSIAHTIPAAATSTPAPTPAPVAIASPDATAPDAATPANAEAPPAPTERTAFKLARQLRNFQGCTHEQHQKADQLHYKHHQRPDVHSDCSSLQRITTLLSGGYAGGTPLPHVLSSPKLMKPGDYSGLDCQAAFEGTSASAAPEDAGTRNEKLPKNLCLSQHHTASRKGRRPNITFDIDSTCCFPISLAFARCGINWMPKAHPILNLAADIHFGLRVPVYNDRGVLAHKYTPLHKIPHYCFGTVIGMDSLSILVFFPALYLESDHERSTYLSKQDEELWYDSILGPVLNRTVKSSNMMQHYPASANIAALDSTAISAEGLARKESAREQLVKHALQPQYLDSLWSLVLQTIDENPGLDRFRGAALFAHAKNTKLEFMSASLTQAYDNWQAKWSEVADPQFYNKDRTFVDLAKQVTSEDSALPYDSIPADHEAEVFLWKKCCLEAYFKSRVALNADGSHARGNPKRTVYPWATMRDTASQTMFAAPHGQESGDGLIYSQFYPLIKTPFDSSKVYVFDNDSVENLALDPGYIRSLQQEGGGITFSKAVCEFGYLHSKKRAYANLTGNRERSYGVREEHRISLAMMEEIYEQWRQWDLYDDEADVGQPPLPYYIVPTQDLLSFLSAQINKYCFLFEHILAHTAMTYSLPETIVMVTALRALRFCYGSSLLQRESLLYKDRWEQTRNRKQVVKEGLGMRDTMERCGLGWFLPKFDWATWRLAPPHGENILVGNMLMHEEYKRRWRAVKDLRDVYIRFNQAESWYDRYNVQHSAALLGQWLEYLHALNLEQFDTDVWKAMLKSHKRSPELAPGAVKQKGGFQFCQNHMKRMFSVDEAASLPHFVTGNKMRFERVANLLDFLFLWEDGKERRGWSSKPYRAILQKSFELIERRLGYPRADQWLDEFFHLVRLTHWVFPYPSNTALIATTKTSRSQGLKGRMMWFSAVYANPTKVELPFRSHVTTLHDLLWHARQQTFGSGRDQRAWGTSQLISACEDQGVKIYGQGETEEYWVVGKRSTGPKGFLPVWERTPPPKLEMLERIREKSLDELEDLMGGFSRECAGRGGIDGDGSSSVGGSDELGAEAEAGARAGANARGTDGHRPPRSAGAGRGIMASFARKSNSERSRGSEWDESGTTLAASSGSVFAPSGSE